MKLEDLPFDIPDNWMWIRQKNVCWLDNGEKEKGEKLPYLEAKVLREKQNPTILSEGVIVTPKERVILVDGENSGEIMAPNIRGYMGSTFKIFSAVSCFNYEFLLKIFLLNKSVYKNSKTGAAIPHLNKEIFKENLIAVPPLAEQQRIVDRIAFIEPLLAKYDSVEKKLSALEAGFTERLKKSILQYAIEGKLVKQDPNDEPASVLLERIKAEKERLIKEGKIKRDKNESYVYQGDDKNYYENLPQGWAVVRMAQIVSLTSGTDLKPNEYSSSDIGIPYITGASNITEENEIIVNRYTDSKKVNSHLNEILLSCKGTIGKIAINKIGNIHAARQFMSITSFIDKNFFLVYLTSLIEKFCANAKSIIPGIDRNQVLTNILYLPPLKEQIRISKKAKLLLNYLK